MRKLIKGMDVSSLLEVEACGGRFYAPGADTPGDALTILRDNGMDLVRLRLWNDPYTPEGRPYGGGTCDLPCVMALARRARDLGVGWMLDLQYSDFWTDPGKQIPPKAWRGLEPAALAERVYAYTRAVLTVLRESGLPPAMVSVGNELSSGLLWPAGRHPSFENIARFLNAGLRAVREELPGVPAMLHLDNGCRNELFRDWLDRYFAAGGADFELLGMSYYPFWHGTMEQLAANLNDLAERYGKDLLVVETAAGFTLADYADREALPAAARTGPAANAATCGTVLYPMTPQGQCRFLRELAAVLRAVPGGHGRGFVYWEPAWLPVPGSEWANADGRAYLGEPRPGGNEWANQTLFDFDGRALPALALLREL